MNHLCMQIHLCQEEKYSQENSGGDSTRPHLLGACCGKSESELPLPSFHNANTSLLSWSQVFKMSPPTLATYRCWAQPERKAKSVWYWEGEMDSVGVLRHGVLLSSIPSSRIFPGNFDYS